MNADTEQKIKQQIIRCGNNAHHLKNIIYQIYDDQIPEIQIISDEASRIEGLCHDMIRQNLNFRYLSWFEGWKVLLRRIKRHIKISQKIIKFDEENTYQAFSSEVKETILNYFQLQEEIVDNVDSYLNKLFIQFTDVKCEQFQYSENLDNKLYNSMDFDTLNKKIFCEDQIANLNDLVQAALESCNRAHNIQNYVVPFQQRQGFEQYAYEIAGKSGEVENQFREIQKNLKMHSHNLHEMKNNIKNQANYAKLKVKEILDILNKILVDEKFKKTEQITKLCETINQSCEFFSTKITDQMVTCAA
ncbi:hypothetical protein ABPG72_019497 [Tetrahymena utriculariae]